MRQSLILAVMLIPAAALQSAAATQLVELACVQPERHANPERLFIHQWPDRPDWYRVTYQARALGIQFSGIILADSKTCAVNQSLPQLVRCADTGVYDPPSDRVPFQLSSSLVKVTKATSDSAFESVEYLEFQLQSPLVVPNRGEDGLPPSDQAGQAVMRFPSSACRVQVSPR